MLTGFYENASLQLFIGLFDCPPNELLIFKERNLDLKCNEDIKGKV